VENDEPVMSFGEGVAEMYDRFPRGDELAAVAAAGTRRSLDRQLGRTN
jgi:hypothetical protein